MKDLDEAIELIKKYPKYIHYLGGGVFEATITNNENILGMVFPSTYRKFTKVFGKLSFKSQEFYGITN